MFNLFDILQSQGGGMQTLGQQFGLSPDQSRRAMEALLPALTIGLQRNAASDPAGFGRLFGLVGAEPHPSTRPPAQPDLLLGQLFGSPALSQAVLQQAATASGIGQHALRQMLPIMAGMVVAGLVHAMLNQPPAAVPLREPEPQPAFPVAGIWNDWMNTFLSSAGTAPSASPEPPAPRAETPASHAVGRDRPPSKPPAPPAPAHAPPPSIEPRPAKPPENADEGSLEVFQQMFQTGVQVQEQNVKAMQDIFDSFWSAPSSESAKASDASPPSSSDDRPSRKKADSGKRAASKPRAGKAP